MDGTLAVLFLVLGLIEMSIDHCGSGCMSAAKTVARSSLAVGKVVFEADEIASEGYFRYDLPVSYGPFQPTIGASIDTKGDVWVGVGAVNAFHIWGGKGFAQLSFMPGIWMRGDGPVLGYPVEFRSGIDAGYQGPDGTRYSLSLDHRSNGELSHPIPNPGLETILVRVSVPH